MGTSILTRTKTSIRYAKENDRVKRERRREIEKGGRRDIEREGEIRERKRERERERERHRALPYKSSGNLPSGEIKRKGRFITKIMTRNYEKKL